MKIKKFYHEHEFKVFFKKDFDFFFTKENKSFLTFSNGSNLKFIEIPFFIVAKKARDVIIFKYLITNSWASFQFLIFQKKISNLLQLLDRKYKKRLIIKGLGMRINHVQILRKLQLKLGFSNLITINVPSSISLLKKKDTLTIEGYNAITVGNFANLVRSLKRPDSFKGKGFWYKNELRFLKPVKKV